MKVFIADKFESSGIADLQSAGFDVVSEPGKKGAELAAALRTAAAEVLVVRSTKVTREILEAADALGLIVRAGAGVDNIDVPAASERGILVANCPGMNSVAVAELTLALILALDRRVPDAVRDLRAGKWDKAEYGKARGLKGRSLGLIGLGPIGRAVAQRAIAFEMKIVAWSRSLTTGAAAPAGVTACTAPIDVARQSDIVSIHVASTPDTKRFIGRPFFEAMREGAYFINTSRGDVVDADALAWAIQHRRLRAGLDVYASEPPTPTAEFRDPLFALDGVVYGTPHIAASTDQAQSAIAAETVRLVRLFRDSGRVENCVNLCPRSSAERMLVVRHRNQPGVLAHVLSHVSGAGINVEEMENVILGDGRTAIARILLGSAPTPETLATIRSGCAAILSMSLLPVANR